MKAKAALNRIINESGISRIQLSRKLGRTDNYLSSMTHGRQSPGCDVMASVADVCGYDLILRKRSTGIEILIDSKDGTPHPKIE